MILNLLLCSGASPPGAVQSPGLRRTGHAQPSEDETIRAEARKMQAEDMEVPIINNLNDNGDRQRPKGKGVFKDQQKESEVNA